MICLSIVIFISYLIYSHRLLPLNHSIVNQLSIQSQKKSADVLVIYVYASTHSLSQSNLEFFVRVAVRRSTNADYYIILQQINGSYVNESTLPSLPSYAHYIQHENKCFDLGTIGWFLTNGTIKKTNYKYFIFLNSSVRGPYLVSYVDSNECSCSELFLGNGSHWTAHTSQRRNFSLS